VVIPFIRGNWQREWSMVPEARLPPDSGGRRQGRHPHARRAGGIWRRRARQGDRGGDLRHHRRGDRARRFGLSDKLVQVWKVSVLLRNLAPRHLQERWFPRIVADPQFLLAH
jgi:hypothetical protein